jgi:prepilin-type N-terminal cleavage/methylation domain-containing protein
MLYAHDGVQWKLNGLCLFIEIETDNGVNSLKLIRCRERPPLPVQAVTKSCARRKVLNRPPDGHGAMTERKHYLFHGWNSLSKNGKGFSLPEVLVAMGVFAMVGVSFISTIGTSYNILSTSDQHTVAESLARAQMDKINNAPYNGTAPYTYDNYTITGIPAGYGVSAAVALVDPQTGNTSATDLGIQKVTVTVTCQRHSPPAVVVLQTYKR